MKPRLFLLLCTVLVAVATRASALVSSRQNPVQHSPNPKPELVLQSGHPHFVGRVVFSRDGRILVTCAHKAAKIWDVATGHELRTLTGHADAVAGVAISPDGQVVASASTDRTVKFWDVTSGKELRSLAGHTDSAISVAFSPDGHTLASGSKDKTIKLWDVATGRELHTLTGHKNDINSVAFSPDGHILASASDDTTIKLWDAASGQELRTLTGHTSVVNPVVFSPDGRTLASASWDKTVKLWDVASGREIRTLDGNQLSIYCVAFSPDGRTLASGGGDQIVTLWDAATGLELRKLKGHTAQLSSLAFSPVGNTLASAGHDGTVRLWDLATGKETKRLDGNSAQVWSVAFSSDGHTLASGSSRGTIWLWDLAGRKEFRSFTGHTEQVSSVAFSPDGRTLASGGWDDTIKLWDVATGKEVRALTGNVNLVCSIAFSPDGRTLASGHGDSKIRLWDVATGTVLLTLTGHANNVWSVAFSPDGNTLASGSWDNTIKLWDVATGHELRTLSGHSAVVHSVAFSPDGHTLASGSQDNTVKLWDIASGRELRTMTGHSYTVSAVAFSPDGHTLASASGDNSVKLWDVASGKELANLTGHSEWVSSVSFSPDGRWLASGSWDGSNHLWDPATGETLAVLLGLRESGEWLVVAPNGLFDGSPAGWSRIIWRFNNNTFDFAPVEAFFSEYYHPELLADIFAGKRPKAATSIENKDRRQPQVQLSVVGREGTESKEVTDRNVTVKLALAEAPADAEHPAGSGVRAVRLFLNGSLVRVWRGELKLDAQGKAALEVTIPIVAGENRLTAYAFNHDNIKSEDATLTLTGADSLKRPGTFYVLAIGVNKYSNPDFNLNFAVADARDVGQEIQIQQQNLARYASIAVVPLENQQATKQNLLLALQRLSGDTQALPADAPPALSKLQPAQPEDAVVIYFAGHGVAAGDRFYLIPHDLGYSGPKQAINDAGFNEILAHGVSDVELQAAVEKIDSGRLLLLIDACNSGQALEADEKRRGPMNSKGLAQLAYEKGMYILAAAQSSQAALEVEQYGHGLLTFVLIEEGLKTRAAARQGEKQVDAREWLDFAVERVPQLQEAIIEEQRRIGRELRFTVGGKRGPGEGVQTPRVFYRREPESIPLIVAQVP